ncbi:MAG: CDP-2,3-bis-(O-geranylgeranyl)-sn-glycerol synthase [Candidatus Altiarchaeota archaeon]|nr:CDP-2,3-bis-(O-geranylgeranyl)-sn-glycerol synthase [Candidatus Altiarchaeota archaeon]
MWVLAVILHALYYISPAYAANAFAMVFGGGKPIDFGRNFKDGRRILGDGKTWRGLAFGLLFGYLFGLLWYLLSQSGPLDAVYLDAFDFRITDPFFGLYLASGALLADMAKSFFKRRLGIKRGQPLWGVDQLDLVVGGLAFAYLFAPTFIIWEEALFLLMITPAMHLFGNFIGYKSKVKDVWW